MNILGTETWSRSRSRFSWVTFVTALFIFTWFILIWDAAWVGCAYWKWCSVISLIEKLEDLRAYWHKKNFVQNQKKTRDFQNSEIKQNLQNASKKIIEYCHRYENIQLYNLKRHMLYIFLMLNCSFKCCLSLYC